MSKLLTDRLIGHEEAREAVQRLINSHFHQEPHARMSIPAKPDEDDDLVVIAYVRQRQQTSADLQRVMEAINEVWGAEGLLQVDKLVQRKRKSSETNEEIDALASALGIPEEAA